MTLISTIVRPRKILAPVMLVTKIASKFSFQVYILKKKPFLVDLHDVPELSEMAFYLWANTNKISST